VLLQRIDVPHRPSCETAREWGKLVPFTEKVCFTTCHPEESSPDGLVFRWPDRHEKMTCGLLLVLGLGMIAVGTVLSLLPAEALLALFFVPFGFLISIFAVACLAYRNEKCLDCNRQRVVQRAGLFWVCEKVLPLQVCAGVGIAWVPSGPRSAAEYHVCLVSATSGLPVVWLACHYHIPDKALALCHQIAARTGLSNLAPVGGHD
jgi:hypothetical protein